MVLQAFYDRCIDVDDVGRHYNFLQEYVAGSRASMSTEAEQESFRNLALEMFPGGPQSSEDHQAVVTKWKSQNKPVATPCPFSGRTTGLVLDHDHRTLRLRGYLDSRSTWSLTERPRLT